MTENPYRAPATFESEQVSRGHDRRVPRPVGVTILAVLQFIGGVGLFAVQFVLFANLQAAGEPLRAIGIPPVLLMVGIMFLSVLNIASAIGMWLILLYFFRGNVLEFFHLRNVNKAKAIGILVAICLAITTAMSVVGAASLPDN